MQAVKGNKLFTKALDWGDVQRSDIFYIWLMQGFTINYGLRPLISNILYHFFRNQYVLL